MLTAMVQSRQGHKAAQIAEVPWRAFASWRLCGENTTTLMRMMNACRIQDDPPNRDLFTCFQQKLRKFTRFRPLRIVVGDHLDVFVTAVPGAFCKRGEVVFSSGFAGIYGENVNPWEGFGCSVFQRQRFGKGLERLRNVLGIRLFWTHPRRYNHSLFFHAFQPLATSWHC